MPVDNGLISEFISVSGRVRDRASGPVLRLGALFLLLAVVIASAPATSAFAAEIYTHSNYQPPPELLKSGFSFAGQSVPLQRKDVRDRIVEQLNYLLMDRRAGVMDWFDRLGEFGPMIGAVLRREGVPEDFVYMAAVLSELTPTAQSRTGGLGWWSLGSVKEKNAPANCKWETGNRWDDRRDPELATRIACARLLWLKQKLQTSDWFLAASAFIDGSEALEPVCKKAPDSSFWDVTAPLRSEIIIPRSIALKMIDLQRDMYGVNVPMRDALTYDLLEGLKLKKEFPLRFLASWLRTNGRSIWELNPGVDPAAGVLGKSEGANGGAAFLRLPKGTGPKIRKLLVQEGYLDG
jgi:membrane-bound lytic murein transglycosylase D